MPKPQFGQPLFINKDQIKKDMNLYQIKILPGVAIIVLILVQVKIEIFQRRSARYHECEKGEECPNNLTGLKIKFFKNG